MVFRYFRSASSWLNHPTFDLYISQPAFCAKSWLPDSGLRVVKLELAKLNSGLRSATQASRFSSCVLLNHLTRIRWISIFGSQLRRRTTRWCVRLVRLLVLVPDLHGVQRRVVPLVFKIVFKASSSWLSPHNILDLYIWQPALRRSMSVLTLCIYTSLFTGRGGCLMVWGWTWKRQARFAG